MLHSKSVSNDLIDFVTLPIESKKLTHTDLLTMAVALKLNKNIAGISIGTLLLLIQHHYHNKQNTL